MSTVDLTASFLQISELKYQTHSSEGHHVECHVHIPEWDMRNSHGTSVEYLPSMHDPNSKPPPSPNPVLRLRYNPQEVFWTPNGFVVACIVEMVLPLNPSINRKWCNTQLKVDVVAVFRVPVVKQPVLLCKLFLPWSLCKIYSLTKNWKWWWGCIRKSELASAYRPEFKLSRSMNLSLSAPNVCVCICPIISSSQNEKLFFFYFFFIFLF